MSPEEWAHMLASYRLDPYGDDWERTSTGTAEIINAIQALAHGFAGEGAKLPRPLPWDYLVPHRVHEDPEEAEVEASLKTLEDLRGL